jgi:hypothetical protein
MHFFRGVNRTIFIYCTLDLYGVTILPLFVFWQSKEAEHQVLACGERHEEHQDGTELGKPSGLNPPRACGHSSSPLPPLAGEVRVRVVARLRGL